MKHILLAAFVAAFSFSAIAQSKKSDDKGKSKGPEIPAKVLAAYDKEYEGKTAVWAPAEGNFEAELMLNGAKSFVLYDETGHKLEVEQGIEKTALPAPVFDYCKKNYPAHKIIYASRVTSDKNVITYETQIKLEKVKESMDLIFDEKGKFIKMEENE